MKKLLALAAVIAAIAFSAPAFSATQEPLPEISAVQSYLNSITTLQARFIQTSQNSDRVAGQFYLNRPGKMRFEYDPPLQDFIVADGVFIYYYDSQMKQQSSTLISQSLADFFLRKDLKLSGDIQVQNIKRDGRLLQVTLAQASDPLAGSLILGFSEKPFELKKWRVVDAQGFITEVELFNTQTGIRLDRDLFHYYDPNAKKQNFNK